MNRFEELGSALCDKVVALEEKLTSQSAKLAEQERVIEGLKEENAIWKVATQQALADLPGEGPLVARAQAVKFHLEAKQRELDDYRRRYKSICTILCWMNEPPLATIERDLCNRRDMIEELQQEAAKLRAVCEWYLEPDQPIGSLPEKDRKFRDQLSAVLGDGR